jgi:hypothetical protein
VFGGSGIGLEKHKVGSTIRRGYYETTRQDSIYVIWGGIGCIRYGIELTY